MKDVVIGGQHVPRKKVKDPILWGMKTGVVYQIGCHDCSATYRTHTCRKIPFPVQEKHQSALTQGPLRKFWHCKIHVWILGMALTGMGCRSGLVSTSHTGDTVHVHVQCIWQAHRTAVKSGMAREWLKFGPDHGPDTDQRTDLKHYPSLHPKNFV